MARVGEVVPCGGWALCPEAAVHGQLGTDVGTVASRRLPVGWGGSREARETLWAGERGRHELKGDGGDGSRILTCACTDRCAGICVLALSAESSVSSAAASAPRAQALVSNAASSQGSRGS